MRYLTIVRHAKAAVAEAAQADFDRPLTKKGYKQIPRITPILLASKTFPHRLITSPATRARQTAEKIAEATGIAGEAFLLEERVYEASAAVLMEVLREQPESAQHVILVGHNPGLEMLVSGLCSGDDARLNLRLSTAGLAQIELEVAHWRQVRWGCGILRLLLAPRFLKKHS